VSKVFEAISRHIIEDIRINSSEDHLQQTETEQRIILPSIASSLSSISTVKIRNQGNEQTLASRAGRENIAVKLSRTHRQLEVCAVVRMLEVELSNPTRSPFLRL